MTAILLVMVLELLVLAEFENGTPVRLLEKEEIEGSLITSPAILDEFISLYSNSTSLIQSAEITTFRQSTAMLLKCISSLFVSLHSIG